jgi:site-specific recombinase XerD
VNIPASISSTGKRERHFFKTKDIAAAFCQTKRTQQENYGRNATNLSPSQLDEAATVFELLKPHGIGLREVVTKFLVKKAATEKSVTLSVTFEKFLASKKKSRSKHHVRSMNATLDRLKNLEKVMISDIEKERIESQLAGLPGPMKAAHMRNLRAVFNYGIKKGWAAENPILSMDWPEIVKSYTAILTPSEAANLIAATIEIDPKLLPYNAIGLFAGVRPEELTKLEWEHVDMVERYVTVPLGISKTKTARHIPMEANLYSCLSQFVADNTPKDGKLTGKVTPSKNLRRRLNAVRAKAGMEKWSQDIMRHSYASYWICAEKNKQNINKLCLAMGHTKPTTLFKHYYNPTKRKDAARYWKIAPALAP